MTEEQAISHADRKHRRTIYSGVCESCREVFFTTVKANCFCSHACYAKTRTGKPSKTGRHVNIHGYVMVYSPGHPKAKGRFRYVREHVLVMEAKLGRFLADGENVHHKNGVRTDNRPENLELWVKTQPAGQRSWDLVKWVVDSYPAEVRALLELKDVAVKKKVPS